MKKRSLFSAKHLLALALSFAVCGFAAVASANFLTIKPSYSKRAVAPGEKVSLTVLVKIKAPDGEAGKERAPVAIALVIDASGSMSDAGKIDYAIKAGKTLVNNLDARDQLALVEYDTNVKVLSQLKSVTRKQDLIKLLETIRPGQYTFLSGGLEAGIGLLRSTNFSGARRVILLSDGLANRGVTNGEQVAGIGAESARKGVTVSTVGLGLDYDETLMQLLAQRGGGNYYYVKDSEDLPSVFRQELSLTGELATRKTRLVLQRPAAVKELKVYGYTTDVKDNDLEIELSDFFAGEERQILMTFEVESATAPGTFDLGTMHFSFEVAESGKQEKQRVPLSIILEADADARRTLNEQDAENIQEVNDEVLLVQADEAQSRALEELKRGNKENARAILQGSSAALLVAAPRNEYIAQKQMALQQTEAMLEAAASDANKLQHLSKASKSAAYKTAQGKKDGILLKEKDSGYMVEALQRRLAEKGFYAGPVNGIYDKAVTEAVSAFQKSVKLPQDGVAGPATQRALGM